MGTTAVWYGDRLILADIRSPAYGQGDMHR